MATHVLDVTERIVPDTVVRELYEKLLQCYYVEERAKVFVKQGKVAFYASTRGHELVQVGVPMLMRPGHDWFYTYYREKSVAVTLGMPYKDIFLGLLNREGDPNSEGVNMPEQWSSAELKLVAQSACTGTQYLPALGAARALRYDGSDAIVYAASGEGATSEGEFFESLNWAGREKLPVLFVVQNNGYAISVPQKYQTASKIHSIAEGFGLPAYNLDGTGTFEAMYQLLPGLIQSIREGKGPALVEFNVVRLDNHSSSDDHRKYRSSEELEEVAGRDPILQVESQVVASGILSMAEIEDLRARIKSDVDRAAEEADSHPFPQHYDVMQHVFSPEMPVTEELEPNFVNARVSMVQAINSGLREEMVRNPKIVMWGEDIQDPKGGVFGVTKGLTDEFGEARCQNSALAEASILGIAGGMGTAGYMPVVEIQFADYIWPAFMQMRDEIAPMRWRSAGVWGCPMVCRVAVGGYIKGGPLALGQYRGILCQRAWLVRGLPVLRPGCQRAGQDRSPDGGSRDLSGAQGLVSRHGRADARTGRALPDPVRQGQNAPQRQRSYGCDLGLHGASGRGCRERFGGGGPGIHRGNRLAHDHSMGQASGLRKCASNEPRAGGARRFAHDGVRCRGCGGDFAALLRPSRCACSARRRSGLLRSIGCQLGAGDVAVRGFGATSGRALAQVLGASSRCRCRDGPGSQR